MDSFALSSDVTALFLSLQQLFTSAVIALQLKILERVHYLRL
jgi:hypothetical protein